MIPNSDVIQVNRTTSECLILRLAGVYCVIMLMFSLFFNPLVLYAFYKSKKKTSSLDLHVITLIIVNIMASVNELPFIIISNFSCGYKILKIVSIFLLCNLQFICKKIFKKKKMDCREIRMQFFSVCHLLQRMLLSLFDEFNFY